MRVTYRDGDGSVQIDDEDNLWMNGKGGEMMRVKNCSTSILCV